MAKLTKAIWGAASPQELPRWHEADEECPDGLVEAAKKAGALSSAKEKAPAGK